ncbi:MAG TPA: YdcF family protein [Albitalea sp.]|uniref:YdcF family protein n=1 Tax=Piscinibacter sp. TaxID=1903157 RepID=UPI002ED06C0C
MNSLFVFLGIESWKPVLAALLLPPVPFLIAILVGARLILPRRGWGWGVIVLSVLGLWFGSTMAVGRWLEQVLLQPPPALRPDRIDAIKADARTRGSWAIVVLGGGLEPLAPEYGVSNLAPVSVERLRYGVWLSRETGVPLAYSGGLGWAARGTGAAEAEAAARIAAQDFNRPLRWTEAASRDTRENAMHSVPLLKRSGVTHILLVTHGWHMARARRHFEDAARGAGMQVEPAPMGLASRQDAPVLDWLPSGSGTERVRMTLREALGRLAGA